MVRYVNNQERRQYLPAPGAQVYSRENRASRLGSRCLHVLLKNKEQLDIGQEKRTNNMLQGQKESQRDIRLTDQFEQRIVFHLRNAFLLRLQELLCHCENSYIWRDLCIVIVAHVNVQKCV